MVVRSGIHSPTKNSQNGKNTKLRLHAEFCKNILHVQRKTPNNAYRTELGRNPHIIKIQKRDVKFYNHLNGSDSQNFHNKAITYRETNLETSPLSKLVLGLCSQTDPQSPRTETQLDPTKS
jgi:hypothetical protein